MHTGNGVVERAKQTIKNLIIANMEDRLCLTESVNRALRVMRFTIHTGLKITPFESHHGKKLRTELTNIVKDGKTYLSNWSEMTILAPDKPQIPIYVGRDAEGEITNHIVMANTNTEGKQSGENAKSPKKKNSVRYPFSFVEKNHNKNFLERRFQNKIQTAISGTENTVKTDTGKVINRKFISGPLFQTEKKTRRESTKNANGEINRKNRHCLRGLDGKYGKWDEILRNILYGKLKLVTARKQTTSDTEEEDDYDEDEEMPEEAGTPTPKVYDTSERDGRYIPIRTIPEEDALQLHTNGEISGENIETHKRRSTRDSKRLNRYGTVPYTGNFWC